MSVYRVFVETVGREEYLVEAESTADTADAHVPVEQHGLTLPRIGVLDQPGDLGADSPLAASWASRSEQPS